MKSFASWLGKRVISGLTTGFFLFLTIFTIVYALNYPDNAPPGETTGGKFMTYFTNMWKGCGSGKAIQGFSNLGEPTCVSAAGGAVGSATLLYSSPDENGVTPVIMTDLKDKILQGAELQLYCSFDYMSDQGGANGTTILNAYGFKKQQLSPGNNINIIMFHNLLPGKFLESDGNVRTTTPDGFLKNDSFPSTATLSSGSPAYTDLEYAYFVDRNRKSGIAACNKGWKIYQR